jgi:membrane protease YdiL (CAAX protease family)
LRPQDALLATFLAVAVVGPLAEEAFFRGFVFTGLARRWGPWLGAVASALPFAVLHGEVSLMVPAFASGLLFAWVFRRSGSLWPAVLAHAAQNALAIGSVA